MGSYGIGSKELALRAWEFNSSTTLPAHSRTTAIYQQVLGSRSTVLPNTLRFKLSRPDNMKLHNVLWPVCACMYFFMCMHVYVCVCVRVCVCTTKNVHECVGMYVCMCVCVYAYLSVCLSACLPACLPACTPARPPAR